MNENTQIQPAGLLRQSENIGELARALAQAHGEIRGAVKDSENPFFKSTYADLASIWDACRIPLSKNGLAVIQTNSQHSTDVVINTILVHSSGQWISGTISAKPVKVDPQGIGSCMTYLRRYALAAIAGVAPVDDDDGHGASRRRLVEENSSAVTPSTRMPNIPAKPDPADQEPAAKDTSYMSKPGVAKFKAELKSKPGSWKEVQIHFGKHKDRPLGDLEPKSLNWFINVWPENPTEKQWLNNDNVCLRVACDIAKEELASQEAEPKEEVAQ